MDGGKDPDLVKLRNEGWKYFVSEKDRKAFSENTVIQKLHPVTLRVIDEYEVLADVEFASSDKAVDFTKEPEVLTRFEWKILLCTGLCCSKGSPGQGRSSRCWEGSGPYNICLARRLQLHPQCHPFPLKEGP